MAESKHYPWNEGLPTGPDVDLLMKTWPEPKIGDRFEYDAIAKLIGVDSKSARFTTVTNVWRRRMIEKSVVIECEAGEAFYVADIRQIAAKSYSVLHTIGRKAKKQRRKLASFRAANDGERSLIEHHARLLIGIERESKKSRMNLIPETKVQPIPSPSKKSTSSDK